MPFLEDFSIKIYTSASASRISLPLLAESTSPLCAPSTTHTAATPLLGYAYSLIKRGRSPEVADAESNAADELLIFDLEVVPVGMPSRVCIHPHEQIELV